MKGRKKIVFFTVLAVALAALLVGIILTGGERSESVEETMRNAVLHESDKISLFGLSRRWNFSIISASPAVPATTDS